MKNATQTLNSLLSLLLVVFSLSTHAQTTAFNYQGKLADGGNPANGSFQMQLKLFDAVAGGSQIGSTLSDVPVTSANGTFSAKLDFGAVAFSGANRWLEIAVRRNSGESYVTLTPREQITSVPFAVKSLSADLATNSTNATNATNSSQLGGLPPSRYVQSDASGNVGIGATPAAGSKLTVGGQIETTSGGVKFPDATTQTTAGLTGVVTTVQLTGTGTAASPLGISSPLSIRDLDNPARQPVGISSLTEGQVYTVPAGKRFVVEYVSGFKTQPSTSPLPVMILQGTGSGTMYVNPETWREAGSTRDWIYSKAVRFYITSGGVFVTTSGTSSSVDVRIAGYLIDTP